MLGSPPWVSCIKSIGDVGRMTSETGQLLQYFGSRERFGRSPRRRMRLADRYLVAITVLKDTESQALFS
jgi:hypothetical protein